MIKKRTTKKEQHLQDSIINSILEQDVIKCNISQEKQQEDIR